MQGETVNLDVVDRYWIDKSDEVQNDLLDNDGFRPLTQSELDQHEWVRKHFVTKTNEPLSGRETSE